MKTPVAFVAVVALLVGGATLKACVPPPPTAGARIGVAQAYLPMSESSAELAADFDTIAASGAKWVRFDFSWPALDPSRGVYDWTKADRAVSAAKARGLKVLATLAYTPSWARAASTTDHYPPTTPADFVAYAAAAADRYEPLGVHWWEIWNEPNNGDFWQPKPNAVAYTDLLKRASGAIRYRHSSAVVMNGGLSPAGPTLDWTSADGRFVSPWRFLRDMYENGVGPAITAVAHHPYTGMPYSPSTKAGWNPFQQTDDLHNLITFLGDGSKKVWGTEAGAWTGTSTNAISEAQQAEFVHEYIQGWKACSFTGPFFFYSLRDLGTDLGDREDNFGLLRHNASEKPAMAAFKQEMH